MKKMLCLCIAILLTVLAGCQYDNHSGPNKQLENESNGANIQYGNHSDPNKQFENESNSAGVQYVIYAASSAGEITGFANAEGTESNISFGSLSERDFTYASRKETSNVNAESQMSFMLNNSNMEADYFRSFSNSLADSANENLHKLGRFDEYQSNEIGNKFTARFRQQDGELVFFAATDAWDATGALTEQDAKALADGFLKEKYGDQFLTDYPNHSIVVTDEATEKIISVCYTKYICGYPTTDRVIVTYNLNGELKGFNAMTKGLFDAVESDITVDKITNAEKALLDTLPSSWSLGPKTLVLDADGGCYLRIYASKLTEGTDGDLDPIHTMELYINID